MLDPLSYFSFQTVLHDWSNFSDNALINYITRIIRTKAATLNVLSQDTTSPYKTLRKITTPPPPSHTHTHTHTRWVFKSLHDRCKRHKQNGADSRSPITAIVKQVSAKMCAYPATSVPPATSSLP